MSSASLFWQSLNHNCNFTKLTTDIISHQGIADELISFIMSWTLDPNNKFACRYILVDATNNPHVLDFYLRNGFLFLFDTVEEELDCLDLEIRPEAKRTRLMYFDLIKLTTSKL